MANICQTDWEQVRATEYFPESFREGTCDVCGNEAFVARVARAEIMCIGCGCLLGWHRRWFLTQSGHETEAGYCSCTVLRTKNGRTHQPPLRHVGGGWSGQHDDPSQHDVPRD